MAGRPFFLRVLRAVCESELDSDTRHVVMVLATYGESSTGIGCHSQKTIADLTGVSERHVRAILGRLADPGSRPVRVERRPRFRADGRGRTSDEWRLVLTSDQPAHGAAYSPDQPAQPAGETSGLTGTPRTTNRHATPDQPAHGAGDLRSDRRSDRRSSVSASETGPLPLFDDGSSSVPPSKAKRIRKPNADQSSPEHGAKHTKVVSFYFETFEAKRGTKPPFDGADGTAVKKLLEKLGGDADKACAAIAGAFADDWTAARTSIRAIASDPAKFIGAKAQVLKTNGRGTPTQPNYGVAIDAEEYS